jgi:hypothetical protein
MPEKVLIFEEDVLTLLLVIYFLSSSMICLQMYDTLKKYHTCWIEYLSLCILFNRALYQLKNEEILNSLTL